MANKRIVLLSDGTGNSAGKVWRTNVWRVFESLDLTSSQQIAFYDDGVGTSSFKPLAILGGAFGFGLKRNVLDIYKFACRNYRTHDDYQALETAAAKAENRDEKYGPWQNDDIFAFGFSRGAFTIRTLNGLICEQGLVNYQTEEELDRKVTAAYRAHRAENFKSRFQVEWIFRKLRNIFVPAEHDKKQRPVGRIAFLGLWDTVAAYGLPVDEMTRGVSRYLWPLEFPDRQLHPLVRRACHALSLDDERTTFHPLLWDESNEKDPKRITQVWFAGVHSNVGGGYPDDSLAHVSLTWILSQARRCGLTLKEAPAADPDAFTRVRSAQDKDGRIYDSRNGLGGYYRYGPRSVAALSDTKFSDDKRDCVKIAMPKIHESVLERISIDAHLYAPVGLPPAYEILTYDERIISPDRLTLPSGKAKYESLANARQREHAQEHVVGSWIWRRRIIYFLTVIASIYLLTYPLTSTAPAQAEYASPLRPISDVIRIVALALPGGLSRWVNAYAREPLWFILCASLVALLLWLSASLQGSITDHMRRAWRVSLAKINLHRTESDDRGGRLRLPVPIFIILLFIALCPVLGWLGCDWLQAPESPQTPIDNLKIFIDRLTHPYFQFFAAIILITMQLGDRTIARFRLKDGYRQFITDIKLKFAPAFFAVTFLLGGLAIASHFVFNFRDSLGEFCEPAKNATTLKVCDPDDMKLCKREPDGSFPNTCTSEACRGAPAVTFDTANLCTAVGVVLERRGRYQVVIEQDDKDKWEFLGAPSKLTGMPLREFLPEWKKDGLSGSELALGRFALLAAAYPLKRTLDRPFGRVILRYGQTGNEENFIDSELTNGHLDEQFTATRDGQLFVYLNQPVNGFFPKLFPKVNSGKARIWVYRIPRGT